MSELLVTKEWLENNKHLVQMKESERYPGLFVVKYRKKVFYDNLWTPELLQCRGLVLDENYNCVVRPFDKIFNYMENGTTFYRDDVCTYTRKVNGFMGAMTFHPVYGTIFSTTGSLDSGYARIVEKHLNQYVSLKQKIEVTMLFEICDDSDRHIIKEDVGAYLIGAVWKNGYHEPEDVLDSTAEAYGMKRFKSQVGRFPDIIKESKLCKHEGFVVRLKEDQSKFLKLKSPYYLTTKFLARKRGDKLLEMLDDVEKSKKTIDEEYYPLLEYLATVKDEFIVIPEQDRITLIENYFKGIK